MLHKVKNYLKESSEDWSSWLNKLKWSLISFKFLSFFGFCGLLVGLWFGLGKAFQKVVQTTTMLHSEGYIKQEHVTDIINTAQTVLYDKVISHVSILAAAVLVAIVGLKIMAERVEGDLMKAGKDLKKFIKRKPTDVE